MRKQILRELQIMHDCNSEYIISFYGAFISDPNICICMEYMDKGSLDGIYKKIGAIDIDVVAKVALAVLEGLTYLYDVHRIIHRGELRSEILLYPMLTALKTSSRRIYCSIRKGRLRFAISASQESSSTRSRIRSSGHQPT